MFMWWRDVLRESHAAGPAHAVVRLGLRYGMTLFIASEVMFFVGFFWAYFHFALYPEHVLGTDKPAWPPTGVATFDPFHLPFLNTMILLLSGTTITWAHHALIEGDSSTWPWSRADGPARPDFTLCQAIEYSDAPFHFSGGGVYPSVFFLATGFHGFHVIVGTLFLAVCLYRARERLHPAAPFRLRGGRLVLALRRRGLAVPVRLHLLSARALSSPTRPDPPGAGRAGCWGRRSARR